MVGRSLKWIGKGKLFLALLCAGLVVHIVRDLVTTQSRQNKDQEKMAVVERDRGILADILLHEERENAIHGVQIRQLNDWTQPHVSVLKRQSRDVLDDIARHVEKRRVQELPQPLAVETRQAGQRPDFCNGCFNVNFVFDGGVRVCDEEGVDVFVAITTRHANRRARDILRQTWLSEKHLNGSVVKYAFFLGHSINKQRMERVYKESNHFSDIIVANFTDKYYNLTYKTIAIMSWIDRYCSGAKYILKTDDDVFVNVRNLLALTRTYSRELEDNVVGACRERVPVRNERSRYFASVLSYPHPMYPPLCSGTGYVTSMAVVRKILHVTPDVPFFHLEDVYIGLCLAHRGIGTLTHPGFHPTVTEEFNLCDLKGEGHITGHVRNTSVVADIWNMACNTSSVL